jgi:hypothetical protein
LRLHERASDFREQRKIAVVVSGTRAVRRDAGGGLSVDRVVRR